MVLDCVHKMNQYPPLDHFEIIKSLQVLTNPQLTTPLSHTVDRSSTTHPTTKTINISLVAFHVEAGSSSLTSLFGCMQRLNPSVQFKHSFAFKQTLFLSPSSSIRNRSTYGADTRTTTRAPKICVKLDRKFSDHPLETSTPSYPLDDGT